MTRRPKPTAKPLKITHVDPGVLKPAEYNPREIDDEALARLRRGIETFGMVDPIIARRSDGLVIGGHQRLRVAVDLGMKKVPVVYLDELADDEAAALNVLLNNPGAQGEWDFSKLADVLSELDANGFDATLTGFDTGELESLLTWTPDGGKDGLTDPDDVPDAPEATVTQAGDLWLLGDHRLICGDATDAETVTRLLDGAVPLLMVTDPPYGVDYDPATKDAITGIKTANSTRGVVTNDDRADWSEAYRLFSGDVAYVWHSAIHIVESAKSLEVIGFTIRAQIIWVKQQHAFGRGHYHWQHEPCWYAVKRGRTAHWIGDRTQSTSWNVTSKQDDHTNHSTQKPVEVMERPIRNHDAPQVYDPFVGSGTTIIAAERQNRACYAMEIDPTYTDVAVQRWQAFTGEQATLDGDGRTFAEIAEARAKATI